MRFSLLFFWGLCALAGSLAAQQAPKYSNEFLTLGVGARALGMGQAQTATVGDVTAGYWNPAGLTRIEGRYEGALMHAAYFAGIANYDYAGFATQIDSTSVLGITALRFGVDDIPDTRFLYDPTSGQIDFNRVRFFAAADWAFLLSYAKRDVLLPGLRLGANFKVIYRQVGNFADAWGFGLDGGAQYDVGQWRFGLTAHDITSTFNAWSYNTVEIDSILIADPRSAFPETAVEITLPRWRLGVARRVAFGERFGALLTTDLVFTFDGRRNVLVSGDPVSIDPAVGLELDYRQRVFLRGGVNNGQRTRNFDGSEQTEVQPNFGLGVRLGQFQIDYALTNIGDFSETLYSNVFSLRATFP
ncbi:MAG: hypothetical protein WBA12_07755 [Catalinimonas sp.]